MSGRLSRYLGVEKDAGSEAHAAAQAAAAADDDDAHKVSLLYFTSLTSLLETGFTKRHTQKSNQHDLPHLVI